MKGLTTMYAHKWKMVGMIISGAGLILMVGERQLSFSVFHKLNSTQHYAIFETIMLYGLILAMYSKEKIEDERVKMLRLKSFQIAFALMAAVMLGGGLASTIYSGGQFGANLVFASTALGIIFYSFTFHIGLYFDDLWDYKDTNLETNLKNIPENKWGILAYFAVSALTLLLLNLL